MRAFNVLNNFCNTSNSLEEILKCIELNTYNVGEIIAGAWIGEEKYSPSNSSVWKGDLDFFLYGMCYIFNSSVMVGTARQQSFRVKFKNSKNYVFLHDPHFYTTTENPNTVPRIFMDINDKSGSKFVYIGITNHIKVRD